jgi:rhodanese-related sulfurtransferase
MARQIDRDEVRELVGRGVALVEVLPRQAYEQEHLRGATNIPLRHLDREAAERLRRDAPVVVYCHDSQ